MSKRMTREEAGALERALAVEVRSPGPVVGYLVDGKLWDPADVTVVRADVPPRVVCWEAVVCRGCGRRLFYDEYVTEAAAPVLAALLRDIVVVLAAETGEDPAAVVIGSVDFG